MDRTPEATQRFRSSDEVERLAHQFLDRTLPYERWTHAAHLAVGVWHLVRYAPGEALDRLRAGITTYNVACGIDNTDSSGYHETITRFYVEMIRRYLEGRDRSGPLHDLVNGMVASPGGSRDAPLAYYTRERLFSVAARRSWLTPDLKPLPAS